MRRSLCLLLLILPLADGFSQHDPGRNAVRLLARGKIEAARELVQMSPRRMNSPVDEAERAFVLAMAACRQGALDEAMSLAREALDQGLPPGRFLAGPRDILGPLLEDAAFRSQLQRSAGPCLHGPLLGAVTDSSAKIWVRTVGEVDLQILLTRAGAPGEGGQREVTARTLADRDFTAVTEIRGLQPNAAYSYRVRVKGTSGAATGEFRTFPEEGTASEASIVFGGGAGFTPEHEHMWTTIRRRSPDAVLLLGDNVYIDDPTHATTQRYCYYRRQSQPQWRELTSHVPVFAIYDDHDFGTDDCVPGPEVDRPVWKREVWQVFRENWANPRYGGGAEQPGCWYDFHVGGVHVIMLDCRYYRDLEGGSMLGPVQKAWLLEALRRSTATFKILASSVPWSPGVKPGSRDTWDGFAQEREEIFSFIESERVDGVLLMAADRHRSDMRRIERPGAYDLYEVMSSRLTNVHTHGLVKNAQGSDFIIGYNKTCSFGQLDIDTTAENPSVTYSIITIDNDVVDSRTLALSDLSFPVRPK